MPTLHPVNESWPPEVDEYYEALAEQRQWPDELRLAFVELVEHYRFLQEGDLPRRYFRVLYEDVEYLFETVEVDEQQLPIRQIERSNGQLLRVYSWSRLEDAEGGLAENSLDLGYEQLEEIARSDFEAPLAK